MDFNAMIITVKDGCLEKVGEKLTEIYGHGPKEGQRGERRWRIYKKEANWYSNHHPAVIIYDVDFLQDKVRDELVKLGLVA